MVQALSTTWIAPGLDWAVPQLFIIDDVKPLSDAIRLFWACLSNPHREPRPALPEACEVPPEQVPVRPVGWGQAQGATRASKQTRHVASELSQDARTNAQDIPKGNGWRRDRSRTALGESGNWGGPVASVPTKTANHRGLLPRRNIKDLQVASLQMASGAKRTCTSLRCA